MRKIRDEKRTGTRNGKWVCSEGLHGADGEEGEAVECEPRDMKGVGHVISPGYHEVDDDAIGWVVLQEELDGSAEEHGCSVDFCGVGEIGDVGHGFDAVGETNLLGGEWDGMNVEKGIGFVKEFGIGGSGDDGDVLAT